MTELLRLGSLEELERWIERSHREPVWLFKHSLACGTSATAFDEFESFAGDGRSERLGSCAIIEVQNAREVSREVARRTGVRHESPQALLLSRGEVVWYESHWRIRADRMRQAVEEWTAGDGAAAAPR